MFDKNDDEFHHETHISSEDSNMNIGDTFSLQQENVATFSCWSENVSPIFIFESSEDIWVSWWNSSSFLSNTNQFLWVEYSPVSLSIWTYKSASSWKCLWDAEAIATSIALKIISFSKLRKRYYF